MGTKTEEKPWTRKLEHGSWSTETKFEVIQHTYWAGEEGYIEAVEIKDPPSGHAAVAIVAYRSRGDYYEIAEWNDVASAVKAVDVYSSSVLRTPHKFAGFSGKEIVKSRKEPWFYK